MIPRILSILFIVAAFSLYSPFTVRGAEGNTVVSRHQQALEAAEVEERILTELRLIKREIRMLKQQAEEPGLDELLAGVGYIFGLFGSAALIASRRKKENNRE